MRTSPRTRSPSTATRPARSASSRAERRECRPGRAAVDRDAHEEESHERADRGTGLGPAQERRHLVPGKKAEKVVPEHLPHSGRRVAGALERRPKQGRAVRGVIEEQGQVLILSESLPNAPLPRACGPWGSWPDSGSWNRSGSTTSRSTCPTWTKASPSTPTCSGVPSARTVPISPSAARGSISGSQQLHLIEARVPANLGQHFAIRVDDLDGVVDELRSKGIELADPVGVGANRQTFLNDPAGNVVELHEVGVSTPG